MVRLARADVRDARAAKAFATREWKLESMFLEHFENGFMLWHVKLDIAAFQPHRERVGFLRLVGLWSGEPFEADGAAR